MLLTNHIKSQRYIFTELKIIERIEFERDRKNRKLDCMKLK